MTITGVVDRPLLPLSPLSIPVSAMPTAVKARHLASLGPVVPDKKESRDAIGRFNGSLVIDSMPVNARVFVNGEPAGITPLVLTDVPVGSRAIRLEADDHASWSSSVRVIANQRVHVNVTLAPPR